MARAVQTREEGAHGFGRDALRRRIGAEEGRELREVRGVGAPRVFRAVALGGQMTVEGVRGFGERHDAGPVCAIQGVRSASARAASAWLRSSRLRGDGSSGGKSPQFTFIGWK